MAKAITLQYDDILDNIIRNSNLQTIKHCSERLEVKEIYCFEASKLCSVVSANKEAKASSNIIV